MKNKATFLSSLLSLATVVPLAGAAATAAPAEKIEKKELRVLAGPEHEMPRGGVTVRPRVMVQHGPQKMEKEVVAFLGVLTATVPPVLNAQLNLAAGSGLVITQLEPDSPASAVLKQHDILLKLDDQLLVDQRQLAVLIRQHKEGDEVTLTYIRGGKQTTAKVKLGKHEVPKLAEMFGGPGFPLELPAGALAMGPGGTRVEVRVPGPDGREGQEEADRVMSLLHQGQGDRPNGVIIERRGPGPGVRAMRITPGNSNIVFSDDAGSLEVTTKDGNKVLVAKNKQGEPVFSGPVNTPDERKSLPPEVRQRFEKLEGMQDITFRTDGDFQGTETRIVRPVGRGISLPLPPPAVAPHPGRDAVFF